MPTTASSLSELKTIATKVANKIKRLSLDATDSSIQSREAQAFVLGLSGDLGAGKTTFTQMLSREFGITDAVTSPTFVLEKIYDLAPDENHRFTKLIHFDWYRLNKETDLSAVRWDELITDPKNLIIVEWPEQIEKAFSDFPIIYFDWLNENSRQIAVPDILK